MAISKLIFNGVVQMDVTGDTVTANTLLDGETATGADGEGIVGVYNPPAFTKQTKSVTYTPTGSQQTDNLTPDVGYDGLERVNITINAIPSGTAGTPTATKGAVSNHAITVTPSVTNTAGYISGGTITGTGVSVAAAELVSGSQNITANNTYDVTNLAEVVVNVAGGGGDPWSWMGKNPTKVKDYGTTKTYLKDTNFDTWTPTTTSTKLSDAVDVSSSYVGDKSLYDYVIFTQMHTHFEYTGGQEERKITDYYANYFCDVYGYENNLTNITSGTNGYMTYQADNIRAGIFYINSSGVAAYSVSNGSGVFMYTTANPTVVASSSTITPKIPQINAACSNTYFNTTNAAAVNKNTSYYELSVQIWRVDKGTSNNGKMQANIRDMWLNGIS